MHRQLSILHNPLPFLTALHPFIRSLKMPYQTSNSQSSISPFIKKENPRTTCTSSKTTPKLDNSIAWKKRYGNSSSCITTPQYVLQLQIDRWREKSRQEPPMHNVWPCHHRSIVETTHAKYTPRNENQRRRQMLIKACNA